uniref:SusC/RagA family TonB-linked outer membrane protein n=1 Tax=Parabacteroides pacaensis TaxID=2086575 RepID=UPI0021D18A09|nr:TonB-dependent receptor [Parabacteroides pacaensis]
MNGTIRDAERNTLPGVNIVVKGTTIGTTTDLDGNYFITVPDKKSILVFQYVGFVSQEIPVGNQLNINVELKENVTDLEEVVVVGFGKQKKVSVVGSITTIEPKKLQVGTTRSMSNNLVGQLSGVIGAQRSGEPGYDNSSFFIRGISSFNGSNNPLILVDGIERDLNNIDPAEIESFSILKDASASAVYGVRGANGVILINTKRGKVGKPSVNIRFEQGMTMLGKLPDFVDSYDYLSLVNEIAIDEGKPAPYKQEIIDKYRTGEDPDLYPNVNWVDAITKDMGQNTRANLEVSGGSEILRYSLVGSFYHEGGIIDRDKSQEWDSGSKLSRYNVRSNVDVNVTPTTLFRVNIGGYLQERRRAPGSVDDLFSLAFETPPYVHPTRYSTGEIPRVKNRANPWSVATQCGYESYSASKIESLFSLEQDLKFLLPGLKVKGIFSFDRYSANSVYRTKTPDYYNPATGRNPDGTLDLTIADYGQVFLGYSNGSEYGNKSTYIEAALNYDKSFGKHTVGVMFMYNQRSLDEGEKLPFRFQGIAGRASYTFDNKYIAEFNFGYNGSENFAPGHRFGFFPSVAAGWVISEEAFMEPYKDTFTTLKIRGSYGLVGNDCLGAERKTIRFPYLTTIGDTGGYNWGMEAEYYRAGRWEGLVGSPVLTWEKVKKMNIGIDLGLWNAVDLSVDYFNDNRYDIFMQRQTIPSSSGFIQTPYANYGKTNNKGVDLSLSVNKQFGKDWTVMVRGTFTYAKSEVTEKDEPAGIIGTNRARTGHPINQIFGLIDDGLFTEDDFVDVENGVLKDNIPLHTFSDKVRPGDIKYKDINDDGKISSLDECAIGGTWDPQIVYGFGATLKYKQIDLGFFFQGNGRTYRIIGGNNFIPGCGAGMGNIYSNFADHWTEDNPRQDAFWPRLSSTNNSNNNRASTWWLHNMSMLRLKNVELGYSFSKEKLLPSFIKSARIFIAGSNLLQFSNFDMWDPEVDTSNGLRYPIMKSVSVGFDINF